MQTTHLFKERCIAREGYLSGYTQAVTDRSAENEKLREALQAMFELVDVARSDNREIRNKAFEKAKQLITEENHGDIKRR